MSQPRFPLSDRSFFTVALLGYPLSATALLLDNLGAGAPFAQLGLGGALGLGLLTLLRGAHAMAGGPTAG